MTPSENLDRVRNGAIILAHPDDESLWCGGLMVRFPCRWTAICCSIPRTDPIRAWKFFDACAVLGATARLLPFVEPGPQDILGHLDNLDVGGFDAIVTHNAVGEYGHRHHVDVHRHVVARWPERSWLIGYGAAPGAFTIALSEQDMARKRAALRCYDHVSPSDGKPKWQALLDRYGAMFDLDVETYERFAG